MSESPDESNILRSPILRSGVDRASRVAVCIDLYCRGSGGADKKVGSGTAFFHQRWGRHFLITNWHVVTARNPQSPGELLDGYPASPTSFQLHLPVRDDPDRYVPSELFPLYASDQPSWFETSLENRGTVARIDLVALPFEFPESPTGPLVTCIEEFTPEEHQYLRVGRDVVIVGYPFGIRAENPFPIWKRGFVASEPSLLIGGLPKYYIDSPGRPGMSGSPVFMITKGIGLPRETANSLRQLTKGAALAAIRNLDTEEILNAPDVNIMQFAGVYSGSVGDQGLERLRVGVAWHAAMVDRLFSQPERGSNPFPPVF